MNEHKILSGVLFGLAILLVLLTWILGFTARENSPVLVTQPREARQTVVTMLDAAGQGDLDTMSSCLAEGCSLGQQREPDSVVGKLLWKSYLDSFTYEILGDCYASDSGVALNVRVTYLDFDSVMEPMGKRTARLLTRRVGQAKKIEEVYDENNEYREDVVQDVLDEAMSQALEDEATQVTKEVAVHLTYENGQWRILPEPEILSAISGGTIQ